MQNGFGRALRSIVAAGLLLPFVGATVQAAPVDSFGEATLFKSKNDLDPVGLAGVTPAADHLFIGGDGIGNGGFALSTDTDVGVQLGLRAGERFISNALPNNGVATYFATPGASAPGPSDPPGSSIATWNYYMHVDLGANLASLVPSGDVVAPGPLTGTAVVDSVILDVDFDPDVAGESFVSVDVYAQAIALGGATAPLLIQDSQNLAFDFWSLLGAPPFDVDAEGVYTLRLTALSGATEVASTEIYVVVGAPEELVVSFGVQGGQPPVETIKGVAVEPADAVSADTGVKVLDGLPSSEDTDGFHMLPTGSRLFSTVTSLFVGGESFGPADIVAFDGVDYSLYLDGTEFTSAAANIDALTVLPNGNILLSTNLDAEIYGFAFGDGDIVEVDPVGETAGLYMGLDEATLFTGTNQDIDALHFDPATGNVLVSMRIDGVGTVGGLPYNGQSSDLFELNASNAFAGSLFLDGVGLYDGATRQLDAAFVPEPSLAMLLCAGLGGLVVLSQLRHRARSG